MWVVFVGGGFGGIVVFAHDPCSVFGVDAVQFAVQVSGEPPVHHAERRGSAVAGLVVIDAEGEVFGLEGLIDSEAVLGHDVPVVEAV